MGKGSAAGGGGKAWRVGERVTPAQLSAAEQEDIDMARQHGIEFGTGIGADGRMIRGMDGTMDGLDWNVRDLRGAQVVSHVHPTWTHRGLVPALSADDVAIQLSFGVAEMRAHSAQGTSVLRYSSSAAATDAAKTLGLRSGYSSLGGNTTKLTQHARSFFSPGESVFDPGAIQRAYNAAWSDIARATGGTYEWIPNG